MARKKKAVKQLITRGTLENVLDGLPLGALQPYMISTGVLKKIQFGADESIDIQDSWIGLLKFMLSFMYQIHEKKVGDKLKECGVLSKYFSIAYQEIEYSSEIGKKQYSIPNSPMLMEINFNGTVAYNTIKALITALGYTENEILLKIVPESEDKLEEVLVEFADIDSVGYDNIIGIMLFNTRFLVKSVPEIYISVLKWLTGVEKTHWYKVATLANTEEIRVVPSIKSTKGEVFLITTLAGESYYLDIKPLMGINTEYLECLLGQFGITSLIMKFIKVERK